MHTVIDFKKCIESTARTWTHVIPVVFTSEIFAVCVFVYVVVIAEMTLMSRWAPGLKLGQLQNAKSLL